ncbi:unnamed protein product [Nyctereutes procyonoides]|uniref:(raccoon dog) hypothetical protein n=1 Tax=Nyctereutes procyonoides TaxID=34880 RepID=A0A811ZZ25_NYCPR|nr:unnamed protein product [Nyctereutes procyonoides]
MRDLYNVGNVLYLDCVSANTLFPSASLPSVLSRGLTRPCAERPSRPSRPPPLSAPRVSPPPASPAQAQTPPRPPGTASPCAPPARARGRGRRCPPGQFPFRAGAQPLPSPRLGGVSALPGLCAWGGGLHAPRSPRSRGGLHAPGSPRSRGCLRAPRSPRLGGCLRAPGVSVLGGGCLHAPGVSALGGVSPRSEVSALPGVLRAPGLSALLGGGGVSALRGLRAPGGSPRSGGLRAPGLALGPSCFEVCTGRTQVSFSDARWFARGRGFPGAPGAASEEAQRGGGGFVGAARSSPGRAPGGTGRRNAEKVQTDELQCLRDHRSLGNWGIF